MSYLQRNGWQSGNYEAFVCWAGSDWQPTNAVAGSFEKFEVLQKRVERGVPLFHPDDNLEYLCPPTGGSVEIVAISELQKTLRVR